MPPVTILTISTEDAYSEAGRDQQLLDEDDEFVSGRRVGEGFNLPGAADAITWCSELPTVGTLVVVVRRLVSISTGHEDNPDGTYKASRW
jgi:hypothetical protein